MCKFNIAISEQQEHKQLNHIVHCFIKYCKAEFSMLLLYYSLLGDNLCLDVAKNFFIVVTINVGVTFLRGLK